MITLIVGLCALAAGGVLGFLLSNHIHQVTNAAIRAVTIPAGVQASVSTAVPAACAALKTASQAAQDAVQSASDKAKSV